MVVVSKARNNTERFPYMLYLVSPSCRTLLHYHNQDIDNVQILSRFPSLTCTPLFSSIAQSCLTLCDPMNSSTPGLPVHHQLAEFTQIHVRRVSDAIQPSHPLLPLLILHPIPPSIRGFSSESALLVRWQSNGVSALASFLPKNTQD